MAELPYAVAGLLVGLLVGATGIGGGALMTPLLIMLFGVNPAVAIGTDLLFAALTKVAGVTAFGARGSIDWLVVRRMLAGSLPGAFVVTVLVFGMEKSGHDADRILKLGVGVMLVITAVMMFLTPRVVGSPDARPSPLQASLKRRQTALTVAAGVVVGAIVASTSIGAGALGTMILVLIYPRRLTPQKLVGTDLAHAIPLAVVAGAGYWAAGNLDFRLLGWLLAGSIPGVMLGALLADRAPVKVLRLLIAVALLVSGLNIIGRS